VKFSNISSVAIETIASYIGYLAAFGPPCFDMPSGFLWVLTVLIISWNCNQNQAIRT